VQIQVHTLCQTRLIPWAQPDAFVPWVISDPDLILNIPFLLVVVPSRPILTIRRSREEMVIKRKRNIFNYLNSWNHDIRTNLQLRRHVLYFEIEVFVVLAYDWHVSLSFYTLFERKYGFMWIIFSMKSQKTQHLLTLFRFACLSFYW
jgi:hypothetical protein